ncbi:hypothetical protein BGW38_001945 [Lunasporangiospora selenospora]|uniref:FAS1 domain-containing protein n=1 Tax=Lunasporangiospora selenospora TaxID=979761 RepID=A0A9P6FUW4_9FUNG|nr:hypothetical protein BGW38_001945 [Lunasporangiospora selenospora]
MRIKAGPAFVDNNSIAKRTTLTGANMVKRVTNVYPLALFTLSELTKLLSDPGTISTMFAPVNEAFDSVSDIEFPTRDLLMYHITTEPYTSGRLREERIIKSLYESPGLNYSPQLLRISLERPEIPSSPFRSPTHKTSPNMWVKGIDEDYDGDDSEGLLDPKTSGLFINHARVIMPDLATSTGAIVHGVNRIVRPPGEHITDEISRRSLKFGYVTRAWTATEIETRIRDSKCITLFAPNDDAWEALPKKLRKYLFSNLGREHLKILSLFHVAERPVYTPEIFNKTNSGSYEEIVLQSFLNSPQFEIHVQAKARKSPLSSLLTEWREWADAKAEEDPTLWIMPVPGNHHYPHKDPNHKHHHRHRNGQHNDHQKHKHHSDVPHNGDGDGNNPRTPHLPIVSHRDEIVVNNYAHVLEGYEDWIAGNGVIHVVDKVLMPPRQNGCRDMSPHECAVWERIWYLAEADLNVEPQEEEPQEEEPQEVGYEEELNLFGERNFDYIQLDDQE